MTEKGRAATERFSERVENYIKYRPGYPPEIIPYLAQSARLRPTHVIAYVGSGTGDFVTAGQAFHWFEPQAAMREFQRILKPWGPRRSNLE